MDTIAPFRITVCGIEELAGHCATGASHVLSILDPDWPVPEAFGAFGEHERLELRFHDVIEDGDGQIAPREEHVAAVLAFGRDLMQEPPRDAHLLVHCHAGISRSSASMALILAQGMPHFSGREILAEVHRIREKAWPNLRMIEMGDAMLGRRGELVAAAHDLYRRQLERRPFLWEFMSNAGRQRELATGAAPPAATAPHEPAPGSAVAGPEGTRMADKNPNMNPGDEAAPGTKGTGEDVCPDCHGSGKRDGRECKTCGGSGKIIRAIGGG